MNCLKGSYLSVFLFVAMCDLKCQFNVKEQSESGHVRGASCTSAIWEGGEKKTHDFISSALSDRACVENNCLQLWLAPQVIWHPIWAEMASSHVESLRVIL